MKLFIINKRYFEEYFKRADYSNGFYYTSQEIHKAAFNELKASLAKHCIPITLSPSYKESLSAAIFDFVSVKDNIYYYEFITAAS